MKNFLTQLNYWLSVTAIGLVLGLSLQMVDAWTEPTQAPPGGNLSAPINTSDIGQYKQGNIIINSNGTWANSLLIPYGNVGIGTLSPTAKLDVSGSINTSGNLSVNNSNALFFWQGGEGETLRLTGNNGTNMHLENINGTFRLVNHPWTAGLFHVDQSGNVSASSSLSAPNICIGGDCRNSWSASGLQLNTWQGNHYSGSDGAEYATIFYDANHSGYYLDPNNTSRLNTLYYVDQAYIVDIRPQYMYDWNDSAYYIDMNNGSRFNWVYANTFLFSSDQKLKKDIQPLAGSLDKIQQLQGVSFYWENQENNSKKNIGLVAQEVEKVFPEIVDTNKETGLKSVAYANLVAPIIESIKELIGKIENISEKMNELSMKYFEQQKRIDQQQKQLEEQQRKIEILTEKVLNIK